jgi:ferredoxin
MSTKISVDNETYEVETGQTIYLSLEEKGKDLPHGCLSGSCGACRIFVHKGADLLREPSVIETDTITSIKKNMVDEADKDVRLSCRAFIEKDGELEIEPIKGN